VSMTRITSKTKKTLEKGEDLQGSNALSLNDTAPLREEKREVINITCF
jgi:hypothetical protein